jgi:DNA (cytosine-5)-methyltransferase 1
MNQVAIQTTIHLHDSEQQTTASEYDVTCGDFFAGGGGVTRALFNMNNTNVRWVLNHDKTAIATNIFHHKGIKHYWSDVYVQDEHELEEVDLAQASIECTQHSKAKGGDDKKMGSYMMGWELVRYIKHINCKVLSIENVPEFKEWGPVDENGKAIKSRKGEEFKRWKKTIMDLGYDYIETTCNSADYGLPTRRVRYFALFHKPGIKCAFPETTHSKSGKDGKLKWVACRPHIDVKSEGHSIFGRKFNTELKPHLRKPHCTNTLRRIAGGLKKFAPELNQFICQYYGGSDQFQPLDEPLYTITTKDRHQLITIEKMQFVQDHCRSDNYNDLNEPLNTQTTRQTKQFVTLEGKFISKYYNSNGNPGLNNQSLDELLGSITTEEKFQFISSYFNSDGKPGSQNQSLDHPLTTILTSPNKKALITVLENLDIKSRFLTKEELSGCTTFPRDYFSKPGLKLSNKAAIKMIGNAVPPEWARIILEPQIQAIKEFKKQNLN